jgi:hypothetical protein
MVQLQHVPTLIPGQQEVPGPLPRQRRRHAGDAEALFGKRSGG